MKIKYDPFQKKAIDYINDGHSVIVSAPTGAGKTAIAEHVIETCHQQNKKVIYTSPVKALSNQKFRDFNKKYPEQIGILTGDITLNPQAPTLIMTTEIFRNKILDENSDVKDYAWVIFDEMHYIDDLERGSVWEESLIFLPDHMNFLGLSATIPNIQQLSQWLETIHNHDVKVVIENNRPVPLHFYFHCQEKIYDDLNALRKSGFQTPFGHFHNRIPRSMKIRHNRPLTLLKHLKDTAALPCIYFVFNRRRTEDPAQEAQIFDFLTPDEKKKITELFDHLCQKFDIVEDVRFSTLPALISKGIAYHHAGMLPTLKEVIEQLFTTRLIKVIFTTETFALGVNMPAKSVVFDELKKFYNNSIRPLKTRDFYQMAGRAGRRSIDKEGFVFLRVNPQDIAPQDIHDMIASEPEKVYSRFNATYATLLNLYGQFNEQLYDVYPKSFHYFQEQKFMRKKAVELLRAKVSFLKELGHIRKNKITDKGLFAGKIYGYELLLAELYENKNLEQLTVTELGVFAVAVGYEPRRGTPKPSLSPLAKKLEHLTTNLSFSIQHKEQAFKITPLSKMCFYHLSPCIEHWMRGETFDEILKYSQVDEGEIVRYFRMGMQLLREILETNVSSSLKEKIRKAIDLINRGVVDAEKQLRS